MNLTIIPVDGAVYVDGQSISGLSFSAPQDVHALQWKSTKGWIEFMDSADGTKPQNQTIAELPQWALDAKTKWDEAMTTVVVASQAPQAQPATTGAQTL